MGNVIKKLDRERPPAPAIEKERPQTCVLCGAKKLLGEMSVLAGRTGELVCRECLKLCALTHAEDQGKRDRRVALAAKEITDVIQKHCLSEGEMWSAIGTAGSYCIMEKGIRR